jgi:hypothetical protein
MIEHNHEESLTHDEASAKSPSRAQRTALYERPTIISHSGEDILEELGPAQACYPFNSCGITP